MTQIITDSVADFEPEELARLGVACVPISVAFGDRSYKENEELSKDMFYRLLRESPDFYVMYSDVRENALQLAALLRQEGFSPDERLINVGVAMGTHIGPNAFGLAYVAQ